MNWISEDVWKEATLPRWKATLLKAIFPRRWFVRLRGKMYVFRTPPPG